MEPRIQYAKTRDGVNISFWTLGEGTPLLVTSGGTFNPSLRSWQTPEGRAFWEKVARNRLVIRYDHRGAGNSDHDSFEHSIDTFVADIEAVADQATSGEFALCGYGACGPFAIDYAIRHPDRVSKLILLNTAARGSDFYNLARLRKAREIADEDPEFYLQVIAAELFGTGGGQAESWVSTILKELDPRADQLGMDFFIELDVTQLLPRIAVPTLVIHRREIRRPNLDAGRTLTAGIPGAQLVVLEGDSLAPYAGDGDAVISAIEDFLADGQEAKTSAPPGAQPSAPGGFATILFTDMEGSTTLADQHGDQVAQEVRRAHNQIVRSALDSNGGNEVKHTGDGIMASFATASSALDSAIAIQRGVAAHKQGHPDSPLGVYVGLNAGEPIAEGDPEGRTDLFGTSVNLAARICDHAQPGQIIASNVVRELAAGKPFLFSDLGETALRGFEDPVKLWELKWDEEG